MKVAGRQGRYAPKKRMQNYNIPKLPNTLVPIRKAVREEVGPQTKFVSAAVTQCEAIS